MSSVPAYRHVWMEFNPSNFAEMFNLELPANNGTALTSTAVFYTIVCTWTGTTGDVNFQVFDGSTWASSNDVDPTIDIPAAYAGTDKIIVGEDLPGGSDDLLADIVCMGFKKSFSSQPNARTLSQTSYQSWRDFGFDWLVGFKDSGPILDDTYNGGDEVSRTGTPSVQADPGGWDWADVPEPTPPASFVVAGFDDGWISWEGNANWPPSGGGGITVNMTGTETTPEKHYAESAPSDPNPYYLGVAYMRWNTSGIPDDIEITSAILRLHINNAFDGDGNRSVCAEWCDGGAMHISYYEDTVVADAHAGITLATLVAAIGTTVDFDLLNPDTNINKQGYTSIRLHVTSMTAPATVAHPAMTLNGLAIASLEHATNPAPTLIVEWEGEPPLPPIGDFYRPQQAASGWRY